MPPRRSRRRAPTGSRLDDAEAHVRALITSWCEGTSGPRRIARAPRDPGSRRRARRSFAGLALDVRLAFRVLRREPAFALLAITLVALAIAATTSLFSVVNSVVLNPLPQVNTDGLVRVIEQSKITEGADAAFSNVTYHAWAPSTSSGQAGEPATIAGLADLGRLLAAARGRLRRRAGLRRPRHRKSVSDLGIAPALGVNFTEAQELTEDAVILSHGFWRERFAAAPDALGRRLTIGGRPRTIVGVMPRGFDFPDRTARVWLPDRPPNVIQSDVSSKGKRSTTMTFGRQNGLARLKPGVTPEQAAAEAASRVRGSMPRFPGMLRDMFGGDRAPRITLTPMVDWMVKDVKPVLWILTAAVGLLFAAAIGDVANMQLTRATRRQREVAIRSAIGAGGGRLIQQLLVETAAITAIGGALGLGITFALLRALPALIPEDFPRLDDIAIDMRVLGVATGLIVAVSLVIGLMPAWMARRVKLTTVLAEDGAAPVGHSLRSPAARSRALIITGQVAIAALLLVGAGLLSQSLLKLIAIDRGYQPANLLTARIANFASGQPATARARFYTDVLGRLQATPGVTHAALGDELPLTPQVDSWPIPGTNPVNPDQPMEGELHVVSTDYIAAMGMRLVRGRGFTRDDVRNSELVILVNEAFAKRYLPAEPLGVRVSLELDEARGCAPTKAMKSACTNPWQVVGIVADVRQAGPDAPVQPEVFAVRSQILSRMPAQQYVIVRTTGDPAALADDLRTIVKNASQTAILEQVLTMETRLMMSLAKPRLYATLLGGFATFALLIALIGLFGGLSYGVTLRTREIGVRTALGATPRHIVSMVMKQGTVMTVSGLAIGLGVAAATVRYLGALLFGVEPLDPATFSAVGTALLLAAIVACAIPARRAARIDAITALKNA